MRRTRLITPLGLWVLGSLAAGCENPDVVERTYFEQRIEPILIENCVQGTADNRCHVESDEIEGIAQGNLDLSRFETIKKRPELLAAYGTYPEPVLLLKAVKPDEISIRYNGEPYTSEIFHAGGGILSRNSQAFVELEEWLNNGATEDGRPPDVDAPEGIKGACSTALRPDVRTFLGQATGPAYEAFKRDVQPILAKNCAFGNCHGSPQSDLYLTCGDTEDQLRHDFIVAQSFVSMEPDRSELLLRPLSPNVGGVDHSGGEIWDSASADGFQTLRDWATKVGPLDAAGDAPGHFEYFASHVMPAMLRRGCAMPQCHSPQGFNDFRLRAGSRGFFSPLALRRNYEATLHEFVSLDAVDPNESRILKKNISLDTAGGIDHRAGITLLDRFGADMGGDPSLCPAGEDDQPTSYCTLVEWIRRERAHAVDDGVVSAMAEGDTVPIIYVDRPANPDRLIEFDTFRGDAQLMRVDATLGPNGALAGFSDPAVIDLGGCAGGTDLDVRGPEISYDASKMVFALRDGESDGLDVYQANLDGTGCEQLTGDGGSTDSGVAIHNFDPVYAPPDEDHNPGGSIVFASTRPGKLGRSHVSPRYALPAANLWRMKTDGSGLEQMTFLNGSEISPAVMQNGQITMSTEKATESLYQVSGRRINWDLTDYHPLLAQRGTIGFTQATEIREALDRDFWFIASEEDMKFGGGTLAIFNRSIGPFESARSGEPGYAPALTLPHRGQAYRSPFPAPDGSVLVSFAGSVDLTDSGANVDFDLVVFDPIGDTHTPVGPQGDGRFQVEGVVAYKRSLRHVFVNIPELVFGGTSVEDARDKGEAWAHFTDLPMLATLLTDNHRGDRGLGRFDQGDTLAIYKANAPGSGAGSGGTFQDWELLGTTMLEPDGSTFIKAPAGVPLILELRQGNTPLLTMTEEHQFGSGELTSLGVHRSFFDGVCGGCHGSVEGPELDVVVNPDALTGASTSAARPSPTSLPKGL